MECQCDSESWMMPLEMQNVREVESIEMGDHEAGEDGGQCTDQHEWLPV